MRPSAISCRFSPDDRASRSSLCRARTGCVTSRAIRSRTSWPRRRVGWSSRVERRRRAGATPSGAIARRESDHDSETRSTRMNRLAGKVALISGGARGQGATETRMFVGEGAAVVFGDVLDDEGKKLEAESRAKGGQVTYVHLDVTREADWRAAVATARQAYGKLNVLVNNAGILLRAKIEETSEADWDRIMAINAKGVFLGTKAVLPAMRDAGGGSIINISSTAGLVGSPGGTAAYTATKGAVRLFTKSTAIQHARDKIRCNSVHPGPIATDMIKDLLQGGPAWEQRLRRLPMGRVGTPEEVAYGVLYLASDESSYVTGSELVIDGGTTAE